MDIKSLKQIPGYKYNEYLLILNPHEELRNKIIQVKKDFYEKYKAENAYGASRILHWQTLYSLKCWKRDL